jgi:hypothetical protein
MYEETKHSKLKHIDPKELEKELEKKEKER